MFRSGSRSSTAMLRAVVVCCAIAFAVNAQGAIPSSEREALVALYNQTVGAQWTKHDGWLGAPGTECAWFGVTCDAAGTTVTALRLPNDNLAGVLPAALSQLTNLEALELTTNRLTGSFPLWLSALNRLRELRLDDNQLDGSIPAEIGMLRNLEILDLGQNGFSGTIPNEIANLTKLLMIGLYANKLAGDLPPEFWRMKSLKEIWMSRNELTGSIPADIRNLADLEILVMWENKLSGPLPVEIAELARLRILSISANGFTGPIPPELGRLRDLEILALDENEFSGTLPPELGDLTKLTYFEVSSNDLGGVPPASLGKLTRLENFGLRSNAFSGPVPQSIANMKRLTRLSIDDNQFTGSIPDFIWTLEDLTILGLGSNPLTGPISPQIRNLKKLELLSTQISGVSGPIPPEIGELQSLQYIFLGHSGISGRLPAEIGKLTNLLWLYAGGTDIEGPLPPEIGNLKKLETLYLYSNRLSGTIPREIGNLTSLSRLELNENALRGAVPREITNLTALEEKGGLRLEDNALEFDDETVFAFAAAKSLFAPDQYQIATPKDLRVVSTTDRTATLAWQPIKSLWGAYQVAARTTPGGGIASAVTTHALYEKQTEIRNLLPETTYYFTITAFGYPDYSQKNFIASAPSAAVTATTTARVLAPPSIELTQRPTGLIQVDGVPRNEDHFTVTNVGDRSTTVKLVDQKADFAVFEPLEFTLEAGASQTVVIRSLSQPAGSYYGSIWAEARGSDYYSPLLILVQLLSASMPTGYAHAEPVESRVDLAGDPGVDSIGHVRFRNVGTAMLTGLLVSDQPWLVPDGQPVLQVFIAGGSTTSVTFRVLRSKRPANVEGTLTANLSLVYAEGAAPPSSLAVSGQATPGISITTVTVVDVARPTISTSNIPAASGVAWFLPGLASMLRGTSSFLSDVSFVNQSAGGSLTDLRLYYTPLASQETKVAALNPIGAAESVTLANVVTAVYGAPSQVGSLQVRCPDTQNLGILAKLIGSTAAGTVAGDLPVFRSDRSAAHSEEIYLAGVTKSQARRTDVYVQETRGATATVQIDFLNESGAPAGASRTETVGAWGLIELTDSAPAGTATVIVRNVGNTGEITAYARVFDESSSDNWSVVDWSRVGGYKLGERLRVPFIDGRGSALTAPRRRAVGHALSVAGSEVTLFNPSSGKIVALQRVIDANGAATDREIVLNARQTMTVPAVGAEAGTSTAQLMIIPRNDAPLVVTARSSSRSVGASIPVIPAGGGLRSGQSHVFSGLEDSTAATVSTGRPGTYRTSFGISETGGGSATVRARIVLDEGRGLATAAVYRDFQLSAGQQIVVDEVVRAIVGSTRDDKLGELHNLQLRVEVIGGNGAVVPFVIITDNATGDSLLRLE